MMRHKRYMRPKVGNAWAYVAYIAYVAPRLYSRNIPSRPIPRPHGADLPAPGGCRQDRTSSDSWPPIYPFTGHLCAAWDGAHTLTNLRSLHD